MSLFETLRHRRGRVLFVSRTNSCRDQIAEAFARALGSETLVAFSAGMEPAECIPATARRAMGEGPVAFAPDQRPKLLTEFDLSGFDVIVNFSGVKLPPNQAVVLEPFVPSAVAGDLESHRDVRGRIEALVRFLIEHFRRAKEWTPELRPPITAPATRTTPSRPPAAPPQPEIASREAF